MYAGFADTELARSNIAIKYRWNNSDFRVAGLAQIGGFNQGNGSTQMWQGHLGGDIHNLYDGTFSLDVVGSYALDGVLTSLFTTPIPKFYSANDLKATLSNNTGFLALTKYTCGPAQLFAGWEYFRQGNWSDGFPNGFKTIANYSVPGSILDNKAFPTVWVTTNAFNIPRVYNTLGGLQICGQRPARCDGSVLLRLAKRLFYDAVRRARHTHLKPVLRWNIGHVVAPRRLQAGQAHRYLWGRRAVERLCGPRERFPTDAEH
jgi:hypothetical protein